MVVKPRSVLIEKGPVGLVPIGSTFVMAILMLLPIGSGVSNVIMPHLVMISVFYWLSSRPLLMPYGACSVMGLLLDLWLAVPLGLNMLLLILTRLFVLNQLKHYRGRSRLLQWGVFIVMSFGLYVLSWAVVSFVSLSFSSIKPFFVQWLVTSFSYTPVAFLMGLLRRWVL